MDFFLNYTWARYELWAIFGLLSYIVFDIGFVLHRVLVAWKEYGHMRREAEEEEELPASMLETAVLPTIVEEKQEDEKKEILLTTQEKTYITEAIRVARSHVDRGQFDEARLKIIEGLSIDKTQKDLNCLLAFIYEKENDFKKAELIYRDLIRLYSEDKDLYIKLGLVLSLLGKYEIAFEIYKKCLVLDENNLEATEMLANLGYQLWFYEDALLYAQKFLKFFPKNFDILHVQALAFIQLNQKFEALEALKKLRQIEPYNKNISDLMAKVELEMELQKNFSQ